MLRFEQVRVQFGRTVVIQDLNFAVATGETVGIVGESGSGKTLTALAAMMLLPPNAQASGHIWLETAQGEVDLLALPPQQQRQYRGRRLAMIFQEPMSALNPVYSCGFQIIETLKTHKSLSTAAATERACQLLAEVQLPDPERLLKRYPHELSGGQMQRVMIAIALAGDPDILIADEPTTALDVTVQAEILRLLKAIQAQRQMSILFISHDLGVIADIAQRVVVMYRGYHLETGAVPAILHEPTSPYTKGLLACRPPLGQRLLRLPTTADFMTVSETEDSLVVEPRTALSVEAALAQVALDVETDRERLEHLRQQPPLLQVKHLRVQYPTRYGAPLRAVEDVSFELFPGETLGLVGESGCGKSTLGRALLRLTPAHSGEVIYDGEDLLTLPMAKLRPLRRELQIIFQDPFGSLDPRMSVGDSLTEPMLLHKIGKTKQERRQRAISLLERVGLDGSALARMPHAFSGGQRQRICIARALATSPRLIVCDESVSALDVSVQAQVLNLLKELQADLGVSYLFISHDLSVVRFVSDRIMVMRQGQIVELAAAEAIYTQPQEDYTRTLLAAIPRIERV